LTSSYLRSIAGFASGSSLMHYGNWRGPSATPVLLSKLTFIVRFGSKADIRAAKNHVRFTPKSGHVRCTNSRPLWAKSGRSPRQTGLVAKKDRCEWLVIHSGPKHAIPESVGGSRI
jgi:hypothetical protein